MAELPREVCLEIALDDPDDPEFLRQQVARRLGVEPGSLPALELRKRSLDARRGRARWRLVLAVGASPAAPSHRPLREVSLPARVVIVGDGPAGMFCAHELAVHGVASIVLDRGKQVQPRRRDLKALQRWGDINEESNYCYGEGGAGTYSDGKLYTRSQKRGNVRGVLETLVAQGAPPAILTDARPHIGSNRLPRLVTAFRERLENVGVVFRFESRVADLLTESTGQTAARVRGVRLLDGSEIEAECVVLATGHSATEMLEIVASHGVPLESKAFAVGVRIEHPQAVIDQIQYGRVAGHPRLPPASYRLAHEVAGRGVFSFCMCPGGFVVPAATESGKLVVNGMSLQKRAFPYANSGLVVAVEPGDLETAGYAGTLGGVAYQRRLERLAFVAGGGRFRAPATRVTDFVAGRGSSSVPDTSYIPGLAAGDVRDVLDGAGIALSSRLRAALRVFGSQLGGYVSDNAVLIAVESRTSSPVRVLRDPATLEACHLSGLYPCGEGAGYAGGIVSAAVDGVRVAEQILQRRR